MAGLARIFGICFTVAVSCSMLAAVSSSEAAVARCAKRDRYCRWRFRWHRIDGIGPVAHITDGTHQLSLQWRKLSASCPISLEPSTSIGSPDRRLQYDECCQSGDSLARQRGFNTEPDGEDDRQYDDHQPTRIHIAWL